MQFRDLRKQYTAYKEEIDDVIAKTLQDTSFIMGKDVTELELKLSEYVGVDYCVSCANGTDALQLALMTWSIGVGDAVFVPDFTFFSSGEVVAAVGATPVFVDIDEHTFNISPESLEYAIDMVVDHTDLTPKAVIAVDLFGQPANFTRIRQIADKYGIYILEDGAQGFGGKIGESKACSFGDISTTSFFPAKPLGCYGDGGAVFTNNEEWNNLLRSFRVHGKGEDKYDNVRVGMNSRLDTIQASILMVKLKHFEDELNVCQEVSGLYSNLLKTVTSIDTPYVCRDYRSSWAQYTILLENSESRRKVMERLKENGIPSMIYYKKPMHLQNAFIPVSVRTECPVTEKICNRCLSIPMGPFLSNEDVQFVANVLVDANR